MPVDTLEQLRATARLLEEARRTLAAIELPSLLDLEARSLLSAAAVRVELAIARHVAAHSRRDRLT